MRTRDSDRIAPLVTMAARRGLKLVHLGMGMAEVPVAQVITYPDFEYRAWPEGLKWPTWMRKLHAECDYHRRCEVDYRGDQAMLRSLRTPELVKKVCMRLQEKDGRDYESVARNWLGADYDAVPWPDRS